MSDHTSTSEMPIEALLSELDPSSAELARAALGWILPEDEPLSELGQVVLQEFLWSAASGAVSANPP